MEKLLTKLKKIEPRKGFKEHSRAIILNSSQNEYHPGLMESMSALFNLKTAAGITLVATFLIITGLSLLNSKLAGSSLASNLDPEELNAEMEEFNIQLSQVNYYEESASKIEIALIETSDGPFSQEERREKLDKLLNNLTL